MGREGMTGSILQIVIRCMAIRYIQPAGSVSRSPEFRKSLTYAEAHPDKESCMVLRGVFLGKQDEIDNVWGGKVLATWCRIAVKIGRLHTPDEYAIQSNRPTARSWPPRWWPVRTARPAPRR